ncbi:MAG: hypothetical protein HQM12_20345 [SAR324 cluster bacterium]|nr:hypothetical protein [SAR324 cluster bacterium]
MTDLDQMISKVLEEQTAFSEKGGFHTVIGSLRWSAKHVQDLQVKKIPDCWGGVFCVSLEEFKNHWERHQQNYGFTELSFLGNTQRLDFFQRMNLWHFHEMEAKNEKEYAKGYSILDQLSTRYPFFAQHFKNHLQGYQIIIYQNPANVSEQFWTFAQRQEGLHA